MIRILFTIVAVLAAILALLLQQPLLFVASGVALATVIVLAAVRMQRRRADHKRATSPAARATGEDLSALGIMEIRPRQKGATAPEQPAEDVNVEEAPIDATVGETPETAEVAPETNGARPRSSGDSVISIKEKSPSIRSAMDEETGEKKDVVIPYLQSLRAAIDAQTICLLRQSDPSLHYHIEAIVSLNAYARSGGDFATKVPLLQTRDSRAAVDVRRISEHDLPGTNLAYYRESIAVKQVAVAPVPRPGHVGTYFVLADSMQEQGLETQRKRALLGHFARLLGAVLDTRDGADFIEPYDYQRPRREIISEEMERARVETRPLALALVHLNGAERVAELGDRDVRTAERTLAGRLRKTAREARVERFGELTFGVFFNASAADVEDWAVRLQRELESETGTLEGGVSIGIAMLQERHDDPDGFRADATEALREAYESGTCTIVE